MKIISSDLVDLINPFPPAEVRRIFGWNHCYRTFTENDDTPTNIEEFGRYMEVILQACPSWGIIDKNHLTNTSHEAPLVGIGLFEPAGTRNGYFHVATSRKAFRTGLIDEAAKLIIREIFDSHPALLRVGAYMDERNAPAKGLCRRLGFKFEGMCEDMVCREGQPRSVVYFGLTRRNWIKQLESVKEEQCQDQTPISPPSSEVLEISQEPVSVALN